MSHFCEGSLIFFNKRHDTIFKILLTGKSLFDIPFFFFGPTGGGLLVKNVVKLHKLPINLHSYIERKGSFCFKICSRGKTWS